MIFITFLTFLKPMSPDELIGRTNLKRSANVNFLLLDLGFSHSNILRLSIELSTTFLLKVDY